MSSPDRLEDRIAEFEANLWNHSEDAFQMSFDERRSLDDLEREFLLDVVHAIGATQSNDELVQKLSTIILKRRVTSLDLMLQMTGQTRNKIRTDLKAKFAGARATIHIPGTDAGLLRYETWSRASGPYLVVRLRKVLGPLAALPDPAIAAAFEALNQATYPGYIRQERAKRSGHNAEQMLATALNSCGIPFVPAEKVHNPMCRDAQIHGVSFDVVVPDISAPRVLFKATFHTSNIGQFGESKDELEIREAATMLAASYSTSAQPLLFAFIDGVGFRSNRAGLTGVLAQADEFCQLNTVWKAVAVCAARAGIGGLKIFIPQSSALFHRAFIKRHSLTDIIDTGSPPPGALAIGEATIQIQT